MQPARTGECPYVVVTRHLPQSWCPGGLVLTTNNAYFACFPDTEISDGPKEIQ